MDKNGKTTHRLNIYYTVLKALIMSSTLRLLMQWYKGIYCGRLSRHELCGSGCDKAGSEGIRAASTWAAPLFSFPTTSLLCCWLSVCQSVCPFISLSVCLKPARVYLHFSSTSIFMMEAGHSTWRCVCVCVCAQDLIGLWSEGILHTESQVEREQGSHCSECYAFSIVSLLLLLYTRTLLWRWHRTPFH